MNFRWALTIVGVLTLFACKKESACLHSNGQEEENSNLTTLDQFSYIVLDGDLQLQLIPDSSNYFTISGGKNSIPFVDYELSNGTLTFFNNNKCNWLRDYTKEIIVELHFTELRDIRNFGAGTIQSSHSLTMDTLSVHQNGTGDINLQISGNDRIWVDTYVIGDVILSGDTKSMIATIGSFGNLKAKNLKAGWINVTTINEGDAHVFPVNAMTAVCKQLGDVYYYNKIDDLIISESDEGKVELVTE